MHSAMRLSMRIVALRVSPAAAEWLVSSAAAKPRPDNALCFPHKEHARTLSTATWVCGSALSPFMLLSWLVLRPRAPLQLRWRVNKCRRRDCSCAGCTPQTLPNISDGSRNKSTAKHG